MTDAGAGEAGARWDGTRTIIICFLAQNLGAGLAFGSFGPLLASNEVHFGVSRTLAASGMSVVLLAIGLLSPIAGALLQTMSVRTAMIGGGVLSTIGYGALASTNLFPLAIVAYAMIGVGVSLLAVLGPLTLVSRWRQRDRGKVLALVNLPLAMFVGPYIIAELLPVLDRVGVFAAMCAIFAVFTPLMVLIVEHPPGRAAERSDAAGKEVKPTSLLGSLPFWLVSVGVGVIAGAIALFLVHIVPFGLERAMSLPTASALISTYAGSGFVGILLFGWITDRIGAVRALALSAAAQALLWSALLIVEGNMVFVVAALIGISAAPQPTLHGAAMSSLFGSQAVRAMGLSFAIKLPFLFGAAPLGGALFEQSGGYHLPFLVCSGALVAATGLFMLLLWTTRGREVVAAGAAPLTGS